MEATRSERNIGSRWTRLSALGGLLGVVGAALIFVGALQTTEAGGGNLPCPDGSSLVAQFEYQGGDYKLSSGTEGLVTVTGDADGGAWTSTVPISAVIVKGGPAAVITTYEPPATSGSFSNAGLPPVGSGNIPDVSNVRFCSPSEASTTTTVEDTTTTVEDTTTTVEDTTTTTVEDTTTTTVEDTTTTIEDTTTTVEETTTTVEDTTTTDGTTTTSDEATTTTVEDTTSTTEEATTSTEAETTTTIGSGVAGVTVTSIVPDTSDELPRTGAPSVPLIAIGALLVLAGITLVIVGRGGQRSTA